MFRSSAPWWLWLAAAAFLGYFGLLIYCEVVRPAPIGLSLRFGSGAPVVMSAGAGSAIERAGLRVGDRVLAYDGYPIRSRLDLMVADSNLETGKVLEIEIDRAGHRWTGAIPLRPLRWQDRGAQNVALVTARSVQLVSLVLAILVAYRRPHDPVARIGVWLLASVGVFSIVLPYGLAVRWRNLPMPIGLLFWLPGMSALSAAAQLFTFCAVFPRPLFTTRRLWIASWTPMCVGLAWHTTLSARMIYAPARAIGMPDWSGALVLISAAYAVGGVALLVANYRRLTDVNERRRIRVLVGGGTLGCVGGIIVAGGYWLHTSGRITDSFLGSPVLVSAMLLATLAIPLSFAYAILRHRLFDVAVIVRQGVRYALARGAVISLVPALAIVVVGDLLIHATEPLATTLRVRGWIYAVIGVLVLAAHRGRVGWLESLDRRFFRERYDAEQLLRQIATDIRDRTDLRHAASRVVAQIDAALHPELTAILTRDTEQHEYRSLAAAPAGLAPPPLLPDSKLIGLLRILGKPIEVGRHESSWLTQQLPHGDTDYLRRARIDLIVPISTDPTRTEAILVLGRKRSEEPYSQEDRDLLAAIAGNLALVLDRRTDTSTSAHAFEECPRCGACYDTGMGRCAQEGAALQSTRLPRMLAARYRLERRLGSGGMGTVYSALDSALDRLVAVKVLRDDLVASAEAAERFKREARTAASFAHPNVVTVHDFGLTSDTRAFLIMELLTGRTLRNEMTDRRRLATPRVVAILRNVCAAVDAAHRRQIIHRDLKPENIFLVKDEDRETAKILDFGIAKPLPGSATSEATSVTGAHQLLGTLAYMAPEQLRGEEPRPAWDVWALAIVTYELLTGVHPFARHSPALLAVNAVGGRETSIREHLDDMPAPWTAFFARALAVEADERPRSAREFQAELEQVVAGSSPRHEPL